MVECGIIDKIRKPKIIGMSIFDWVATFIFSVIIALLVNYFAKLDESVYITIIKTFIIMMFVAILAHYAFGIPTMLNYYLGLNTLNAVLKLRKDC